MPGSTPHIRITQDEGRIAVDQHRPNVTGVLGGLSLEEAVLRIPLLLPICGHAQGIAAQRAAAAARGESEPHTREHSVQLWHEQAIAAAWRLTIDWPGSLDRERDIALFKAVQNADGAASLANHLLACVPGLDNVETQEELALWLSESGCTPASVLRRAMEMEDKLSTSSEAQFASGETLQALAQSALDATDFNPLAPTGAGIEVGPLAMQRHPMIAEFTTDGRYGALSRRLLAQLLDTLVIANNLRQAPSTHSASHWTLAKGLGLGCAVTARGPVFHRVMLDDAGRVQQWRVLAPTDWHFAPGGPLEQEAGRLALDDEQLRLLVLGLDPCAPWTLEEPAHA